MSNVRNTNDFKGANCYPHRKQPLWTLVQEKLGISLQVKHSIKKRVFGRVEKSNKVPGRSDGNYLKVFSVLTIQLTF